MGYIINLYLFYFSDRFYRKSFFSQLKINPEVCTEYNALSDISVINFFYFTKNPCV